MEGFKTALNNNVEPNRKILSEILTRVENKKQPSMT
jgi:hypothetical protein